MAAKQTEVHSFKRIQDQLKNDVLPDILLFYGREKYLVRWSVEQIKARYVDPSLEMFNFTKFEDSSATAGAIIDACETMPVMSEKRVVLVENADFSAEDGDELASYFSNFPETTVLIFVSEAVDKRKKFYKAVQKAGDVYEFGPLAMPQLRSFVTKRLRASGKKFDPEVAGIIVETSGYYDKDSDYTIDNLVNDIEKVVSHSGDYISAEDVDSTVTGNVERDVFAFSEALASGRRGDAIGLLNILLTYGENVFKLLGLICSQFETMLLIKEMREAGYSTGQMHQQLGIHEYRIKKTMPQASKYSVERLRSILMKAYEVDRNIKSGLMEAEVALELLVAGV